jgi:TP901 family phage tail tape measure protein
VSKLGEVFVEVLGDADPLAASIGDALEGVEREAAGFGQRFESALTGPVAKGAAGVGAAAAGAIAAGVNQAIGLDAQLREVVTLFGETGDAAEASVTRLQGPVRDLSTEIGIAQSELVDGLYNAISAGVPEDNVFEFLETAGKFAIGGVTDVETAVDGLTTAINAFGLDAADADQVADAFFAAVQGGKTNAEELSASLFQVAPAANAAGLGLEETLAGVAALTASGTPTSVATTQMRAAINELASPTTKVAGIFNELTGTTFRDFIAAGGSLEEALAIVGDAASESGDVIGDYFGSVEAAAAATVLYNDDSGAFAANLELQANAAGAAADAYGVVAEGAQQQLAVLKQQGLALLTVLGQTFLPIVNQVLGVVTSLFGAFTNLPEPVQRFLAIGTGLVAVLGPLPLIIGKMLPLFKSFATVFGLVTKAVRLFNLTLLANPLFLIIAAVIAVVAILWYFRDEIIAAIGAAWDWLKDATSAVWEWLKGVWSGLLELISGAWTSVIDWFRELPGRIVNALQGLATTVWEFITTYHPLAILWRQVTENWETIASWFRELPSRILETLGGLATTVLEFIRQWHPLAIAWRLVAEYGPLVLEAIVEFVTNIATTIAEWVETIVGFVTDLWQRWVELVHTIRDAVIDAIVGLVTVVVETVAGWVASIIGFVTDLWAQWTGLVQAIRDAVIEFIVGLVASVIATVSGWVTSLLTFVSDLRRDFVATISSLVADVVQWFRDLPGKILSAIGDFGSLLLEAGKDLIRGLISGITSMGSAAVDAAKDVGRNVVDGVKGFFRIGSPSRVFAEIGGDVIDGLTVGIDQHAGDAAAAAREMAEAVTIAGQVGPLGVRGGDGASAPTSIRPAEIDPVGVAATSGRPGAAADAGPQVVQHISTSDPVTAGEAAIRKLREVAYLHAPFTEGGYGG